MRPNREEEVVHSVNERAGEWCVRLSTGSLAPPEREAFDSWIAADPAHAAAFDRALTVWQGLHAISDAPEMIGQRADALDALRRANRRRWSQHFASRWQWGLGLAACLALVLVSVLVLLGGRPTVYATATGERRALLLADGSRLSLDAETKVAVVYRGDQRALTLLAGRAKFDVAHDPTRPFTVTAGDRTVIATGTVFSVELVGRQVHVILYDGKVAVLKGAPPPPKALLRIKAHPDGMATALTPGLELVSDIAPAARPLIVQPDINRSLAWEGGQLNFVDEPLASAVERLNRYSATKIVIDDPHTAAIQINGVFNAGDSTAFVEAVSEAYPVRVEHDGATIVLNGKAS